MAKVCSNTFRSARTLDDYTESLEFNPERLEEVEDRIELIANLKL